MSELRVTYLKVQDVLGVEEREIKPGRVTTLRGRNASGKSTLLSSVQAALGRGSLAKIARVDPGGGETKPEVVLVLDGRGEHYRVERKGDALRVRKRVGDTQALEDVPRPQEFLAGLFDPTCSNPVRFLTAPDKDRALLLLEALPLKMDRAALFAAMGVTPDEVGPVPVGLHALEEIGMIRERVFAKRTGVNRDVETAKKSADGLRRNIPAEILDDPKAEIDALQGRVDGLATELGKAEADAGAEQDRAVAAAVAAHDQAVGKIASEFQSTAKALRAALASWEEIEHAKLDKRIAEERGRVEASIKERKDSGDLQMDGLDFDQEKAVQAAAATRAEAEMELAALRNTIAAQREQLAALRARSERASADRALAAQAEEFDRQHAENKAAADRLTAALDALDAYRRRLAENLPIPGLSIEDRVIRVNGVPYEQLNTQARIDIAVKVATLRARGQRLPVLFVDGAEALDAEHFDALVSRLASEGVQAFVARVEDSDLEVETPAEVGA